MNSTRSVFDPGAPDSVCWCQAAFRPLSWLLGGAVLAAVATAAVIAAGAGPARWADDLTPIGASDWDYDKAAHLLERAGFGGTPAEIERLAAMTPAAAVDELVDFNRIDNSGTPAFDASPLWDPGMDPFPKSRAEAVRIARETGSSMGVAVLPAGESRRLQPVVNKFFYGLRSNAIETQRLALWFGERMLVTRRPLEEKLTLFWHGHFATGQHEGPRHADDVAAERNAARQRRGQFSRPSGRDSDRPGDARVSGQRREPEGTSERELRP